MNSFAQIDLKTILGCEDVLGKKKVEFYMEQGVDFLLNSLWEDGAYHSYRNNNSEIIRVLAQGHHRSRALLKLGVEEVELQQREIKMLGLINKIRLEEIPLLPEPEYKIWFENNYSGHLSDI